MIVHGMCPSAKEEFFQGIHKASDLYMLALYNEVAGLGPQTTVYSPEDEVYGKGYVAGGQALKGYITGITGEVAWLTWTEPVIWMNSTINSIGGLIYNRSANNRAIGVLDFGDLYASKNGTLVVSMPPKGAGALILWG